MAAASAATAETTSSWSPCRGGRRRDTAAAAASSRIVGRGRGHDLAGVSQPKPHVLPGGEVRGYMLDAVGPRAHLNTADAAAEGGSALDGAPPLGDVRGRVAGLVDLADVLEQLVLAGEEALVQGKVEAGHAVVPRGEMVVARVMLVAERAVPVPVRGAAHNGRVVWHADPFLLWVMYALLVPSPVVLVPKVPTAERTLVDLLGVLHAAHYAAVPCEDGGATPAAAWSSGAAGVDDAGGRRGAG